MAKNLPKLGIHLNLLKPQGNPEKTFVSLLKWLLATGRYIFIFVEALVLIAFVARFKLDADISSKKEAIEQQIPYIESLKPYETLIRKTQLKLSTVDAIKTNSPDFSGILVKIADQTPATVRINSINLSKDVNLVKVQISGQSQNNNDLTIFFLGLKQDGSFSNVAFTSIGFEKGAINFSISASFIRSSGGANL